MGGRRPGTALCGWLGVEENTEHVSVSLPPLHIRRRGLHGGARLQARQQRDAQRRVGLAPALAPPAAGGAARRSAHGGWGVNGVGWRRRRRVRVKGSWLGATLATLALQQLQASAPSTPVALLRQCTPLGYRWRVFVGCGASPRRLDPTPDPPLSPFNHRSLTSPWMCLSSRPR